MEFPEYFDKPNNLLPSGSGPKVEPRIKHSYPRHPRQSQDSRDMVVDVSPSPERMESCSSSDSAYQMPVSDPLPPNLGDTVEDEHSQISVLRFVSTSLTCRNI